MLLLRAQCVLVILVATESTVAAQTYSVGSEPPSPCAPQARSSDLNTCLDNIRIKAGDPDEFWFGTNYSARCNPPGQMMATCYKPGTSQRADSIITRLFNGPQRSLDLLDRFIEVTYTTEQGSYVACENTFHHNTSRTVNVDPLSSSSVMTSYEVRTQPEVSWRTEDGALYTLLIMDVGYLRVQAMYINIPGVDLAQAQTVFDYEGPANPTHHINSVVFMLFRQPASISLDTTWRQRLTTRDWQEDELLNFVNAHSLQGPVAFNWVSLSLDAFGVQVSRTRGFMNTCAYLVADAFREQAVEFIPNAMRAYGPEKLNVYVNITFASPTTAINSCCNVYSYPEHTFNLNPLGNAFALAAHVRTASNYAITLHMSTALPDTQRDFTNSTLTLVMADPDSPVPRYGNLRLPYLHWLRVNIRGGDVGGGVDVTPYMGSAPPDPIPHRYYYLIFRQSRDLDPTQLDYSAVNCSWAHRGRCRYNVTQMVLDNDLDLVGATWMRVQYDEYVRELYIQNGQTPPCVVCKGVTGYADPCPLPGAPPTGVSSRTLVSLLLTCVVVLLSLVV